jgi:hypothetical protein
MIIDENVRQPLYNIVIEGKTVLTAVNEITASQYLSKLTEDERKNSKMVPATENGKEILLG